MAKNVILFCVVLKKKKRSEQIYLEKKIIDRGQVECMSHRRHTTLYIIYCVKRIAIINRSPRIREGRRRYRALARGC